MKFRSTLNPVILSFVVGISLLLFASACKRSTDTTATPRELPVPVSATPAVREDVPVILTGIGNVQAYNSVTLKSRIDGQIMSVNFREGQDVHKGQLLLQIDSRPYKVALDSAKANLARDQAQLNTAKANLKRSKALLDAGVVARQDYDTQVASAGQYDGTVAADRAAIDSARLNLVYTRITSPIEGRVGLRQVDPGNIVHAADTTGMLVINQMHPISVVFTIPEDRLPDVLTHIRKGDLRVGAYSRDDQTLLASGRLETVDNQIDTTTGTAKLKAVFDNKDNALWPNQFVNIHLQLSTMSNALVVPAAALQRGPSGTLIYVVGPDKRVRVQPVTVSLTQNNYAVITSGINAGDLVVTEGQDKLQAATLVSVKIAHSAITLQPSGTTANATGTLPATPSASATGSGVTTSGDNRPATDQRGNRGGSQQPGATYFSAPSSVTSHSSSGPASAMHGAGNHGGRR